MIDISEASIRFARKVYIEMIGREVTTADADQLALLSIAFDAAEKTARSMYEAGVAEEREACAALADESRDFVLAERIRARVSP